MTICERFIVKKDGGVVLGGVCRQGLKLMLDWMYLRKFSSDFCKNRSGGYNLMVRD